MDIPKPKDARPTYKVKITGQQNDCEISYELKSWADNPIQAIEEASEWAQHHTDDWLQATLFLFPIKYYD
jgi:hypothetical protein